MQDVSGPMADLYFEDFSIGQTYETGGATLDEAAIIDFARSYDPQYFHLDAEAAKGSMFGGLIASGFQTLATSFRLFADLGLMRASGMGGPAMDEVRWLRPVRPGDRLSVTVTVREANPSRSRPDRGSVRWGFETKNQAGETVLTALITSILARRPAG